MKAVSGGKSGICCRGRRNADKLIHGEVLPPCVETESRFPAGVTELGENAFGGCWKLETLDLPEGLTTIGQDARSACEQLREVRLPSKLKEIGRYAFHETLRPVKKLERLDIPEGVTKIGDYAFGCRPRLTGIFQPL